MKLLEVVRLEVGYQLRRPWTWVYFAAVLGLTWVIATQSYLAGAQRDGYYFNSPYVIVAMTAVIAAMALLVTAAMAGDAGARDIQTRMHPLVYTTPLTRGTYVRGRFLAAFLLNALILLATQIALLAAAVLPIAPAAQIGPFRASYYILAYLLVALPNAFVGTALLFAMAVLSRRAISSYLGAVLLFFSSVFVLTIVAGKLGRWDIAKIIDPLATTVINEITRTGAPAQKNSLAFVLNSPLFWNRVLWVSVGCAVLGLTHLRFRFAHPAAGGRRQGPDAGAVPADVAPITVKRVRGRFGIATRVRQVVAIAAQSFRDVAFSWGGLVLVALAGTLVVFGPTSFSHLGIPVMPTTQQMIGFIGNTDEILWLIVPMLSVYYVGELVWRDRDTGMSEIADAAPVSEAVRLAGKLAGLSLVFVAYQTLLIVASIAVQLQLGYHEFEPALYARVMYGLQLPEHLLFAVLAFAVHVIVNHKYAAHMAVLLAYGITMFAGTLGIEHNLLIYGAAPEWFYSDMRGFANSILPFVWFKLYWGAWALLLAVIARLFWVRSREQGISARMRAARRQLRHSTLVFTVMAVVLVGTLGSFVFYNTNVLNQYQTSADYTAEQVAYERRYGRFEHSAQPAITAVDLRVEIHPDRAQADIRGRYRLVNHSSTPITAIHITPESEVETGAVTFDRPARLVVDDRTLRYRMYELGTPLLPGDTLRADFSLRFAPRGFTNGGIDPSVTSRATFFDANDWLPAIGYQRTRGLTDATLRAEHGLPARIDAAPATDSLARADLGSAEMIALDVVIGTEAGQTAIAPGTLRRSWREGGRRYFHYATDAPIRNDFAIFSAPYAVRRGRWRDVDIEIVHLPRHPWNTAEMLRSVQASLETFTKRFGPYPHRQLRLVEHPGEGNSLHAYPINVSFEEEFAIFNPKADTSGPRFRFAVVAHEIGHAWFGNQLTPADVEGTPLLTESVAWYAAMLAVEETFGVLELERLRTWLRESSATPRTRAGVPLLRIYDDRFAYYRKGPFALFALREYVGAEAISGALRRLVELNPPGRAPLPTALDLYRELQAVTPDSLRDLLEDLFERNTYWELAVENATARRLPSGSWQLSVDVDARKVAVDSAGTEAQLPMHDLIEMGVYEGSKDERGATLQLTRQRIRTGRQRLTFVVEKQPAVIGIDPRELLIDLERKDNVASVSYQR